MPIAPEQHSRYKRPVRQLYTHKRCGFDTLMSLALAEHYAAFPEKHETTFCVHCGEELDSHQFVWKGTTEIVGQ